MATEFQKQKTGDPEEKSKTPDASFDEVAAAGLTGAVIGGVVVLVLALLLGGGGGMSRSAAQKIQFGIENFGSSYEKAMIGAACLNAGHRWEYDRCRYEADR
jgi:hypothetical protein